eukprot:UN13673
MNKADSELSQPDKTTTVQPTKKQFFSGGNPPDQSQLQELAQIVLDSSNDMESHSDNTHNNDKQKTIKREDQSDIP